MDQLKQSELLAKLSLWKHEQSALLAAFTTTLQVALGGAELEKVTDEEVSLRLVRVVKHVPLGNEAPLYEVRFNPRHIRAAWLSSTFEQPQHVPMSTYFDELVQIFLTDPLPSVTIYRATKQQPQ